MNSRAMRSGYLDTSGVAKMLDRVESGSNRWLTRHRSDEMSRSASIDRVVGQICSLTPGNGRFAV